MNTVKINNFNVNVSKKADGFIATGSVFDPSCNKEILFSLTAGDEQPKWKGRAGRPKKVFVAAVMAAIHKEAERLREEARKKKLAEKRRTVMRFDRISKATGRYAGRLSIVANVFRGNLHIGFCRYTEGYYSGMYYPDNRIRKEDKLNKEELGRCMKKFNAEAKKRIASAKEKKTEPIESDGLRNHIVKKEAV